MSVKAIQEKKRAVITQGMLFDEELTGTVLKLTGPDVDSESKVREILAPLLKGRIDANDWKAEHGRPDNLFSFDGWLVARDRLLEYCELISRYDRLTKAKRDWMIGRINSLGLKYQIRITDQGLDLWIDYDHVLAMAIRALLPFFLPQNHRWSPHRLFRCRLSTCGQWFLRPIKSGTAREFCSTKHANLYKTRVHRGLE